MKGRRQKLLLAAGCLVCTVVAWRSFFLFEGTEFGGGSLAGDKDLGGYLFVLALILALKFNRIAAAIALVACVFSLPLYLYLVFPRPFRQVWRGQWKVLVPPQENFVWDGWWITGILCIVFVASVCCRILSVRKSAEVAL